MFSRRCGICGGEEMFMLVRWVLGVRVDSFGGGFRSVRVEAVVVVVTDKVIALLFFWFLGFYKKRGCNDFFLGICFYIFFRLS